MSEINRKLAFLDMKIVINWIRFSKTISLGTASKILYLNIYLSFKHYFSSFESIDAYTRITNICHTSITMINFKILLFSGYKSNHILLISHIYSSIILIR